MISAPESPWDLFCSSPLSSAGTASPTTLMLDDWIPCLDFSDLAPVPLTPVDLAELLDLDGAGTFDISDVLLSDENSPSFNLSKRFSSTFESEGATHQSKGFSASFEPDGTEREDGAVHQRNGFSSKFEPKGADGSTHQTETIFVDPLLNTDSSSVSSPFNSDAGSSVAVGEAAILTGKSPENHTKGLENHGPTLKSPRMHSATSSHKRQHEDLGSDIEGDRDGKSEPDRKKQRLLRNRELAFESRQRKKCYVSDLEAKCKMLEQECNQLQQQTCFAAAENAVLKEELARMKKMKGRDGVAEPAVLFEDSLPLEFLSLLICMFLLMARLSLCVSPFLALVLRAILLLPSPIKAGVLLKEQVGSKGSSHFIIDTMRRFLEHVWRHMPFAVCGLLMDWLTWQGTFSYLESFCIPSKRLISYNLPFR